MATRSRFKDFTRLRIEHYGYRRPAHGGDDDPEDDTKPIQSSTGDHAVEMGPSGRDTCIPGLPPDWADIIADLKDIEKEIDGKMNVLTDLQKKHLNAQPFANRDEEDEERSIEIKTSQIAKLFKEMEGLILLLEKQIKEDKTPGRDAQRRMVDNMKVGMVMSANTLSRKFRDGQRLYLQRLTKHKEKKGRFQSVTGGGGNTVNALNREDQIEKYLEKGLTQDQIEMIIINERNTQDRDQELKNILSSIMELHEMFRDMNALVIEQGTVLDRIDYNLTVAREKIVAGVQQVSQAKHYQDQTKWKLCFL
eukprot:PhF_6_TR25847/c0_g1_i1/m.36520/K08489/STX16; syntaxin 16